MKVGFIIPLTSPLAGSVETNSLILAPVLGDIVLNSALSSNYLISSDKLLFLEFKKFSKNVINNL